MSDDAIEMSGVSERDLRSPNSVGRIWWRAEASDVYGCLFVWIELRLCGDSHLDPFFIAVPN